MLSILNLLFRSLYICLKRVKEKERNYICIICTTIVLYPQRQIQQPFINSERIVKNPFRVSVLTLFYFTRDFSFHFVKLSKIKKRQMKILHQPFISIIELNGAQMSVCANFFFFFLYFPFTFFVGDFTFDLLPFMASIWFLSQQS